MESNTALNLAYISEVLHQMADKYGDVFTIFMGSRPVVMVAHQKTIRQVMLNHGDSLLDRPDSMFIDIDIEHFSKFIMPIIYCFG